MHSNPSWTLNTHPLHLSLHSTTFGIDIPNPRPNSSRLLGMSFRSRTFDYALGGTQYRNLYDKDDASDTNYEESGFHERLITEQPSQGSVGREGQAYRRSYSTCKRLSGAGPMAELPATSAMSSTPAQTSAT